MSDRSLKIKVGALVVVATVLLVFFVALLGGFSVGKKLHLHLELTDSGSLLAGAPVKIAGVRAGRVSNVEFLVKRGARKSTPKRTHEAAINVRVSIAVDAKMAQAIRQDSEFFITTQGVLGEKYVEIVPGSEKSAFWPDGSYIRAADPPRIDLLFVRVDNILAQVETVLGGEDLNLGELVRSTTRLAKRMDTMIERHEPHMDTVMLNLAGSALTARSLLGSLEKGLGDGSELAGVIANANQISTVLATDIAPITRRTRRALKSADTTLASVRTLVKDNAKNIDATLTKLPGLADQITGVGRDTAWLVSRIRSGQGTIGQLLVDQEIYDDLKEMLRDLKRHPWKMLWRE